MCLERAAAARCRLYCIPPHRCATVLRRAFVAQTLADPCDSTPRRLATPCKHDWRRCGRRVAERPAWNIIRLRPKPCSHRARTSKACNCSPGAKPCNRLIQTSGTMKNGVGMQAANAGHHRCEPCAALDVRRAPAAGWRRPVAEHSACGPTQPSGYPQHIPGVCGPAQLLPPRYGGLV